MVHEIATQRGYQARADTALNGSLDETTGLGQGKQQNTRSRQPEKLSRFPVRPRQLADPAHGRRQRLMPQRVVDDKLERPRFHQLKTDDCQRQDQHAKQPAGMAPDMPQHRLPEGSHRAPSPAGPVACSEYNR